MTEDAELLRRYFESRSEADFAELVRRYLGLVYHAALRRTNGRTDIADDISQYVFLALARNAEALIKHRALAGWLYTTTRIAVSRFLRAETRRRAREEASLLMDELASSNTDPEWNRVRLELDMLLDELSERDREALLLRYFQERPFAQIGAALGTSEDAARKRVDRAVERLRSRLLQRGITSTAAALGALLTAEASLAAPASLAKIVTTASLTPAAGAGLTTLGILELMSTTKSAISVASVLTVASLLSISGVAIATHEVREARRTQTVVLSEQQALSADDERLKTIARATLAANELAEKLRAELEEERAAAETRAKAAAHAVSAAAPRDPAEDGRKFLAEFSGVRGMLMQLGRAQIRQTYASFYRAAHLSPSQIDAFETLKAQDGLETMQLTRGRLVSGPSQLSEGQMRGVLGEAGLEQFKEYERAGPAHELSLDVRASVAYVAAPLSDEQEQRLTDLIATASSSYASGQKVDPANVDWTTVIAEAKKALTPEQWQAAESIFLRQSYQQSLAQAQRAMPEAPGKPTP